MRKPRATRNSQCRVCCLPPEKQSELERLHVGGASFESLAKKFGLSRFAVMRHLKNRFTLPTSDAPN
jgi:hypothetical protein